MSSRDKVVSAQGDEDRRQLSRRTLLQGVGAGASLVGINAIIGGDDVSAQEATGGGTLIEGFSGVIESFAPLVEANRHTQFLFDTLVSVDAATLLPVPNLAASWEISPDGLVYTFALAPGVMFHDGEPLTSADVTFTLDLLVNPETASPYGAIFGPRIASVEAPDPATVVVTLTGPVASFLVDLSAYSIAILPRHLLAEVAPADLKTSDFAQSAPVGSGPFTFKEYLPGEALTLEANPAYHRGAPKIGQYVLKFIADSTVAYQQLKTGEVDVTQISADFYEDATSQANFTAAVFDSLEMVILGFNVDPEKGSPALQDVKVRQALAYAIDRQLIIDRIFSGLGTIAVGTESPVSWAYQPDAIVEKYEYDPEKAASLLDEAGWTVGADGVREKDGQTLAFTAIASQTRKTDEGTLLAIQEFLKEIGVELTPQFDEQSPLATQPGVRDFEAILVNFTFPYDPDQSLAFDSAGIEAGYNLWGYDNPAADDLLHRGLQAVEVEERQAIYAELQNLLLADLPVFVMHFVKGVTGVNNRVQNYAPSAAGYKWAIHYDAPTWSVSDGE